MTNISESGIEAALLPCPFCGGGFEADLSGTIPLWRHKGAIGCPLRYYLIEQADADDIARWNRRHPPASREAGLSSVLDAYDAETAKVPLGHENRSRGASTYNWRRAIVAELRALIPTKPEAKEAREVSDEMEVLRRLADGDALAYSRDSDNCWFTSGDRAWVAEATVIAMREKGYLRRSWAADDPWGTDGISDAGRAALQSKKPE